jgi:hypothetical protein
MEVFLYCFPSVAKMYCYTTIFCSPPPRTYLWKQQHDLKRKENSTACLGAPVSHINIYCKKKQCTRYKPMNRFILKFLAKEPITTLKTDLVIVSSNRVLGFLFVFPPFLCLPFLPYIANAELLISTNLRNHFHFITSIFYHPRQAFPRPPPQCILLPNTILSLVHTPCKRLLSSLSNPQQICHSYSDIQMHIMRRNFFRFMEQKMTNLITTSVCFYFIRTIFRSPMLSVVMEKSRESPARVQNYRDSLLCYESKS